MLRPLSTESAVALREAFHRAGFSQEGFRSRPGFLQAPTRRSAALPLLIERTREPLPVNVFLRLFVLGLAVDSKALGDLLPDVVLDGLIGCGALRVDNGRFISEVMITPIRDVFVANDVFSKFETDASGLILWPNNTTRMLWKFVRRQPAGSVLDLGAGSGVLAVLASEFAGTVTATDLNPRGEEFVRFNAALNGLSNLEAFTGDTFEPVAGRSFDLILCNPPFFITPSAELMYGENSMELDGYCRRVIREGANHLKPDGHLQMLFEWAEIDGEPWRKRILSWLDGTGCDAWLVRTYSIDPTDYAHQRNRELYVSDPERATTRFNEFVEYYRTRRLVAVHGGLLTLRRRSGPNWIRIDENRHDPEPPHDGIVEEVFATEDLLRAGEEEIRRARPIRPPALHFEKQFGFLDSRCVPDATILRRGGTLPSTMAANDAIAELLALCDGTRTVEQIESGHPGATGLVKRLAERRMLRL